MQSDHKRRIKDLAARTVGWFGRTRGPLRILTYHSVQAGGDKQLHLAPDLFEDHVHHLAEQGYRTYRVRDLASSWPKMLGNGRGVVLTFDDGLANNRDIVCPILRKYGFTATFFVPTVSLGSVRERPTAPGLAEYQDLEFLCWSDLCEMIEEGFEIGAHSHTHVMVARQSPTQAEDEIAVPKRILDARLQVPVTSFSYPKGHANAFSDWTRELLHRCGYTAGCTMVPGTVDENSDLLQLPRIGITPMDDLGCFRRKLAGWYDFLRWFEGRHRRAGSSTQTAAGV